MLLKYTARRENLYTFIIVFISEFVQIFSPCPVVLIFKCIQMKSKIIQDFSNNTR